MFRWVRFVVGLARAIVKSRRNLLFENIALRHPLLVLSRKTKQTRSTLDRALWVWLSFTWKRWTAVLWLVQVDTVVRWHRQGFRLFWRWKSRAGKVGRKRVAPETVDFIRQMSRANPLWGAPRIQHLIGEAEFIGYHQFISPRVLAFLVAPLVLGTVFTVLMLWSRPAVIQAWAVWAAIAMQAVVWISTVTIQVPIQLELSAHGRSLELLARLIETNFWYRRIPYAACAVLFLWMAAQVMGLVVMRGVPPNRACCRQRGAGSSRAAADASR